MLLAVEVLQDTAARMPDDLLLSNAFGGKVVTAAHGRSCYRTAGNSPYRGSGNSAYRGSGRSPYRTACRRTYRSHLHQDVLGERMLHLWCTASEMPPQPARAWPACFLGTMPSKRAKDRAVAQALSASTKPSQHQHGSCMRSQACAGQLGQHLEEPDNRALLVSRMKAGHGKAQPGHVLGWANCMHL